jgi:hypothetical protein
MPRPVFLVSALALAWFAGCSAIEEKEWMKVGEKYTTAEFRKDMRDCSKTGKVDEDCMRARGWVSVSPGRVPDKPLQPPTPTPTRSTPGRY